MELFHFYVNESDTPGGDWEPQVGINRWGGIFVVSAWPILPYRKDDQPATYYFSPESEVYGEVEVIRERHGDYSIILIRRKDGALS